MEYVTVVRVLGTLLCLGGAWLCWKLVKAPATTAWKFAALAALLIVPLMTMGIANYHTFEGVHEVDSCARCHVMRPMVNDMRDASSGTLAARHFKNRWIAKDQCYECHSDYGLSGNLAAKMEGFRHLARLTTRTYHEPIVFRGRFDNANCLKCHSAMKKFQDVQSHRTIEARLRSNDVICLNCHGLVHPTRSARTPGSADYTRLMEKPVEAK